MLAVKPSQQHQGILPAKVMLVDDSIVARSIFERILSQSEHIEIVCQAGNPEEALALLSKHDVDIILLDIEMPGRSGLDALSDLIEKSNGARILVVSSFAEENGSAAIQALSLGACDTLSKPGRSGFSGRFTQILFDKVIHLAKSAHLHGQHKEASEYVPQKQNGLSVKNGFVPSCLAIGASTGGIPAIYSVIDNLDDSIDCPIFITQHLPSTFIPFFATQLASKTRRNVSVSTPGVIVQKNHIYVAPGDAHLVCRWEGKNIILDHDKDYELTRYCPSVDAMFSSIAAVYGNGAIAIVLSGMGNDGTLGGQSLALAGAKIFVQDSCSSVVWGMPGSIARSNLADVALPPDEIGGLISRLAARNN